MRYLLLNCLDRGSQGGQLIVRRHAWCLAVRGSLVDKELYPDLCGEELVSLPLRVLVQIIQAVVEMRRPPQAIHLLEREGYSRWKSVLLWGLTGERGSAD